MAGRGLKRAHQTHMDAAASKRLVEAKRLFERAEFDSAAAEDAGRSDYSYWGSTFKVFFKNRAAVALLILLVVLVTFTFIQPLLPGQYGANVINNNPETGKQFSNVPPSMTTVAMTAPAGTRLFVKPIGNDGVWYAATDVIRTLKAREVFTMLEYGVDWCKVDVKGTQGYVKNDYAAKLKLPENPTATPYEAKSNFPLRLYAEPIDYTNDGTALYAPSNLLALDGQGGAVTTADAPLRVVPSTQAFWFGTNIIGQDLWARVWAGTRTSLFIGFIVALIEAVVGIFIGVLWGYVRSLDRPLTEVYNVIDNIPTTIVLILISYVLRPSMGTLILAMSLTRWLGMARFIRNQIVIIRDRDYNLASRCLGTGTFRIIARNLLPYLVSVIMLSLALAIPEAIGSEVFITYIGLGLPLDIPSLGNLINEGRKLITTASLRYQLFFPAIVLSLVTISFYIIGNAFADAADPKNHV